MSEHKKADQARKGLVDSIMGKAKEFVGAVTGNDSLTAEGQLKQTQARERKEANRAEAVADAEVAQARADATEATLEGAEERRAVNAEAAGAQAAADGCQFLCVPHHAGDWVWLRREAGEVDDRDKGGNHF